MVLWRDIACRDIYGKQTKEMGGEDTYEQCLLVDWPELSWWMEMMGPLLSTDCANGGDGNWQRRVGQCEREEDRQHSLWDAGKLK